MSTSSWRANSRHVSPNHPVDYRHITRWTIAKYPCKLSPNHPVDGPSAVPRRRYGCQTRSCATCPASLTPNCRTACRERGLSSSKDQEHAARPRRPAGLPRAKRCWTPTGTHAGWWTRTRLRLLPAPSPASLTNGRLLLRSGTTCAGRWMIGANRASSSSPGLPSPPTTSPATPAPDVFPVSGCVPCRCSNWVFRAATVLSENCLTATGHPRSHRR